MSIAVAVSSDGARAAVAATRVSALANRVLRGEGVREALVSVTFVTDRHIARLNREHLGHAGPTDVISFAFAPARAGGAVIGDVYIAPAVARENARDHGVGVRDEIARLVVHGLLHVLGHDHPTDAGRSDSAMWRRQERYVEWFRRSARR